MSFDGFFVHALTQELSDALVGGRIHKIYQPFQQELQFVIRSQRVNHRLHATIHPTYYRLHLTQDRANNPQHAPLFCMLLRKHLENAQILSLKQLENDRIIIMELSGRDELGDMKTYQLIFELMGRHSNIVLVNPQTNSIIDCIKHIPAAMNTHRTLQPGAQYILPPRNTQQTNLFSMSQAELVQFATNHQELIQAGKAHQVIQGLSSLAAKQLQAWVNDDGFTAFQALEHLILGISHSTPITFKTDKQWLYYAMDLPAIQGERTHFDSLSQLLTHYYEEKTRIDRVKQVSGDIIHRLTQLIQKNQTKLKKLAKDRDVAKNADSYRIMGELINAYAYQITKGQTEVTVTNYYTNEPYTIMLSPKKTAIENSQSYFKRYSKYRDSLKYIDEQERATQQEVTYLEAVLLQLTLANIEDIDDIKLELQQEGYLKKQTKSVKKRVKSTSSPRRYRSSDGVNIYVGRNNQQNDELSLKKASKNHWWLHAKDIPGSHVIIESDKPSETTLQEAAILAAYYSKSQSSANVAVDAVQVKHLRKPNGSKPGYVIYEGQKTLYVTPDIDLIEALSTQE